MRKNYLVIIDESDELKNSIYFAAKRSRSATNANLIMLYVVRPAVNTEWASVGNLIEQEETSEGKKISRLWSTVVEEKFKIKPQDYY
jgi:hypothetical protein